VSWKALSSHSPAGKRFLLNLVGVVVLVSGLSGAASIWLDQDRIDRQQAAQGTNAADAFSPEDSRRYTHDVELYYGQTGLLMDKWKRWFDDMTHGKLLARNLAITSVLMAGGLFYVAAKSSQPTPPPKPRQA
jgi:hypothetical protein